LFHKKEMMLRDETVAVEQPTPAEENALSKEARVKKEQERHVKLGMLVVQLGGASFDEVFPDGLKNPPELTCIIGKPQRPSWWSILMGLFARRQALPPVAPPIVDTTFESESEEQQPPPEVKPSVRQGLPTLDFSPLPDAVVRTLHADVQRERKELLEAEAAIHEQLQRLEETRYQYLAPDMASQRCANEIRLVARCYAETNAADGKMRDAQGSRRVLSCAPLVRQLQLCAELEVEAFATSD
jgi:hypothetical protein